MTLIREGLFLIGSGGGVGSVQLSVVLVPVFGKASARWVGLEKRKKGGEDRNGYNLQRWARESGERVE